MSKSLDLSYLSGCFQEEVAEKHRNPLSDSLILWTSFWKILHWKMSFGFFDDIVPPCVHFLYCHTVPFFVQCFFVKHIFQQYFR